jgi:hypothetical protein
MEKMPNVNAQDAYKKTFLTIEKYLKKKVIGDVQFYIEHLNELFLILTPEILEKVHDDYYSEDMENYIGEYVYTAFPLADCERTFGKEVYPICDQKGLENLVWSLSEDFDETDAAKDLVESAIILSILQVLNGTLKKKKS